MATGVSLRHFYLHMGVSLILWILVILAVLIDLWDGVYTARRLGQHVHSHKLRLTIRKIGEYWRFILMGFVADSIGILFPFWTWPYLSILICLGIIGIEAKSVMEHAKKRKSHIVEIPSIIKEIIECATEDKANELLKKLKEFEAENDKSNLKEPER